MKDLQDYYELLVKYNDPESVSAIWAEINELIKKLDEIKKLCRTKLENYLRKTGEVKLRTKTASIGWTKPEPKLKLNQAKWQAAVLNDSKLYDLVKIYDLKRAQIEDAQKDYIEEVTSEPRLYIR